MADALVELVGLEHEGGFLDTLQLEDYDIVNLELLLVFVEEGGIQLVLELSVGPEEGRELLVDLIEFLIVDLEQFDGSAEGGHLQAHSLRWVHLHLVFLGGFLAQKIEEGQILGQAVGLG